jgi:putative ABC transport system permease protein
MTMLNRKLVRDLWHLRSQMVAVTLVVICGVGAYVSMSSTYRSLVVSQDTYYRSYRFADVFAQLKRAPASLAPKIASIPGVSLVQTRIVFGVTLDIPGQSEPATGQLVSIPEKRTPMLNDLFLRRGRYVEPNQHDEIIVSEAFAEANQLNVGDTLSAVLNERWERLRIVGIALSPEYVYEVRGGGDIFPDNRHFGVLWMSEDALGPAFNMKGAFNDVALSLSPGANLAEVISRLDFLLEPYGGLGAYGRGDQISNRFLSDEIEQNQFTGTFIPAIFLGVAAFLLHIVLSRLVNTQRGQIGVLKAFGYGNRDVGLHYLGLALVPVLAGLILGTWVGLYLGSKMTAMYAMFYRFPLLRYVPGAGLIAAEAVITLGAACLGALSAVRRALRLPPAEAMRPEAPPHFRRGLAERSGLDRWFSPAARIILRNLERRPLKALLSSVGVGFAVAILVVGLYFFDAMRYLIKVQFENVQREDATVVFNNPRTSRIRHDVGHLPGVLDAEPFRLVPVRLRFEHRSRRVGLLGLYPGSDLRHLVDQQLRSVELPPEGLVLTAKLAEILGVSPGDAVTVEVLEGSRAVRVVPVTGLVDELIGLSAYMDARAVNRLTREGETISGAYLRVDASDAPRLYSLLKRMPAVSGVSIHDAVIASFNDTLAKSLAIFTTVLVVFACVIAVAIVYNGARIALSERGNELASLRVLGFTQNEIALILLGEQAFLILIAIPLGFALGLGICALVPLWLDSELYRMPLVVNARSYAFASLVIVAAGLLCGLAVRWRLRRLDLIAVLKARE